MKKKNLQALSTCSLKLSFVLFSYFSFMVICVKEEKVKVDTFIDHFSFGWVEKSNFKIWGLLL